MSIIAQMGSLLLRSTPPPSYDPDAQAIFDMLTTPIDSAEMARLDTAIKMLKGENALSRSVWHLFDFLPLGMQGAPTQELSLIDWKQKRRMTPHGGMTWTKAGGWKGDGANGTCIATGFNPTLHATAFTRNNASSGFRYSQQSGAAKVRTLMNCGATTIKLRVPSATYQRLSGTVNSGTEVPAGISDVPATEDIYYYQRSDSSLVRQMKNGVQVVSGSAASVAVENAELYLLNASLVSSGDGSPDGIGMCWVGSYLENEDYQVLKAAHDFYIS